mmetsp:Transcript_11558/g.22354  ORF Transcript_11558/g.22354 Transcript_11558/m.22354 type:complete len:128 (+) Transcript_11558:2512-2895(+)
MASIERLQQEAGQPHWRNADARRATNRLVSTPETVILALQVVSRTPLEMEAVQLVLQFFAQDATWKKLRLLHLLLAPRAAQSAHALLGTLRPFSMRRIRIAVHAEEITFVLGDGQGSSARRECARLI